MAPATGRQVLGDQTTAKTRPPKSRMARTRPVIDSTCPVRVPAARPACFSRSSPISDVRGSRDFRLLLAENVLLKFFHEVGEEVQTAGINPAAR